MSWIMWITSTNTWRNGNLLVLKRIKKNSKPSFRLYYVYGKSGYYAKDCRHKKQQKKQRQVNTIDEIIAMVSEINAIQNKVPGRWYDICVTIHVCKSIFKTYHDIDDGQEIQMGNEWRSKVIGKGDVEIIFTSRKKITLTNVLYVPKMNKNLASWVLLEKSGIKSVFELGKLVLTSVLKSLMRG